MNMLMNGKVLLAAVLATSALGAAAVVYKKRQAGSMGGMSPAYPDTTDLPAAGSFTSHERSAAADKAI